MYSKYIDNADITNSEILNVSQVADRIVRTANELNNQEKDPHTDTGLEFYAKKYSDENFILNINNRDIEYNSVEFSFMQVRSGQESNPIFNERIKTVSGNIVIYSDGVTVQYLINRARGAVALSLLRKLNSSDKNKVIEAQKFDFSEDLIFWIISRFMNNQNELDENSHLSIEQIIGFKGEGREKQAVLSGSGNQVMNLLGTLTFLAEMDSIKQVGLRFDVSGEKFEIVLYSDNSQLDVIVDNYVGEYMLDPIEKQRSEVLISIFTSLLPNVIDAYKNDDDWKYNGQAEFVRNIVARAKSRMDEIANQYPVEQTTN